MNPIVYDGKFETKSKTGGTKKWTFSVRVTPGGRNTRNIKKGHIEALVMTLNDKLIAHYNDGKWYHYPPVMPGPSKDIYNAVLHLYN